MPGAATAWGETPEFVWAYDKTPGKALIQLGLRLHDYYPDDVVCTGVNLRWDAEDDEYIAEVGVCNI